MSIITKIQLMFNKNSLTMLCGWLGIIVSIIIVPVILWLVTGVIGLGVSHAIYGHAYNMSSGISLFPGDKTRILCYNDFDKGGCMLYGLMSWLLLFAFALLCALFGFLLWSLRDHILNNIKTPQSIKKILSHCACIIIGITLLVIILYFLTISFGLALMYMEYGNEYNMTNGLPLVNNRTTAGPLMCYNTMTGIFFVGCFFPGLIFWLILLASSLVSCLISSTFCCGPLYAGYNYFYQLHDTKSHRIENDSDVRIEITENSYLIQ